MANQIGFVDNTGSEGVAHWQMLDTIRRFATGYGTAAAPVYVGTGNGTLTGVDTYPATVTETWTITATSATAFSVTGSVSGAQAAATVGTPYDNGLLKFTLIAGATAFVAGDQFTIATTVGALPAAQRWTPLRYLNPTPYTDKTVTRELILQGVGLSGTEQIFIGFRAYQDQTSDYYNLTVAAFTGYVAANAFTAQPGYIERGCCAHNQRIDYWLAVNGQRVLLGMKISTSVYETCYTGKFYPYALPQQYPYPIAVFGTLGSGMPAVRFSDASASHTCGAKGYNVLTGGTSTIGAPNGALRQIDGSWINFTTSEYSAHYNNSPALRRDTGGYYGAKPIVLLDGSGYGLSPKNAFGEFDGIRYVSGFNNLVESTVAIGGVSHIVMQDVFRTGIGDYFLLEMN